ncbi:kinase-like domain-containing protein [Phialemonium atrogriseum]|uniref:Kinase-like domain-containing protein n=1 Tax=Phialemonium atrogriseum TaxID=1093897 RepID=A0AAJ0C623_9PEZI|nr:kinase-like domain-containing protein [Phialemonium atrogriseum]KAK1770147.1 kinase-like domain-containing protein [Phialemonium atrogriseum]
MTEDEIYDILGEPVTDHIELRSRTQYRHIRLDLGDDVPFAELTEVDPLPPKSRSRRRRERELRRSAPKYVVDPVDLTHLPVEYLSNSISIMDFDQAYPAQKPPRSFTGIRPAYTAPEVTFELKNGPAADVWALSCCIFRMRCSRDLFTGTMETPLNSTTAIYRALRPFPEHWTKVPFHKDHWPLHEEREDGTSAPREYEREFRAKPLPLRQVIGTKIVDRKAIKSSFPWRDYPQRRWVGGKLTEDSTPKDTIPISPEEADCFHDLLQRMFVYEPDKRISAAEVLSHPWFQGRPLS